MTDREFSVYQFFADKSYERVLSFVDGRTAVTQAAELTRSVGGRVGTTRRVIITDGGDYTVFEWRFGRGVVYPPEDGQQPDRRRHS
jgi:hypothetical protein